jgi:multiple sugar transport system ATP-binding protein
LKVLGSNKAEIDRKVREAAEILQLTHLLDRLPKALSGGQRQRVAIGRAIVKEPRVFLFDEPLSNLDAALRVQTRLEIAKLHHRIGTASMIYVTHDQVEAMTLADKIVLLNTGDRIASHGSVAQVGSPMALYYRPNSLFVAEFIGSPKMNILPAQWLSSDGQRTDVSVAGRVFTAAVDARTGNAGQAVHLGLRPEDMRLVADGQQPNTFHGTIAHIEKLGESSMLYIEPEGQTELVTLKVEGTTTQQTGTQVCVQIAPELLHLFNAQGDAYERTVTLPV